MILYEGNYSGRLQPWRHYVPLKKDHSNMAEVAGVLRDDKRAQAIVDAAFREVALNSENSFAAMTKRVDRTINRAFRQEMAARRPPYTEQAFDVVRETRTATQVASKKLPTPAQHCKIVILRTFWYCARLVPGTVRRWVKSKLLAWPRARNFFGIGT